MLRCAETRAARARYVFDTLLLAAGIHTRYVSEPPGDGPWLLYAGSASDAEIRRPSCLAIAHCPDAWHLFDADRDAEQSAEVDGLRVVLPLTATGLRSRSRHPIRPRCQRLLLPVVVVRARRRRQHQWPPTAREQRLRPTRRAAGHRRPIPGLPVAAPAVTCATAWASIAGPVSSGPKALATRSCSRTTSTSCRRGRSMSHARAPRPRYATWCGKRDPADALRAMAGLLARASPAAIPTAAYRRSSSANARSACARRSRSRSATAIRTTSTTGSRTTACATTCDRITDAGFDLCLHGSYRSTENPAGMSRRRRCWRSRLGRPRGSRQHFLSFDYDTLVRGAGEQRASTTTCRWASPITSGRAPAFRYPYFPYCLEQDRPYDVLQISLFLMDVTLRGYMGLKRPAAGRRSMHTLRPARQARLRLGRVASDRFRRRA